MSSFNNIDHPDDEVIDTDQDEELARALQEQFRLEVEQYAASRSDASREAWVNIHSIFTPPSAPRPAVPDTHRTDDNPDGDEGNDRSHVHEYNEAQQTYSTPSNNKHRYQVQNDGTPETMDTESSTPDASFEYEEAFTVDASFGAFDTLEERIDQLNGEHYQQGYGEQDGYILDNIRGNQHNQRDQDYSYSQRNGNGSNNINNINNDNNAIFLDAISADEALARQLQQELHDEEMASNLAHLNRASSNFAVSSSPLSAGIVVGSDPRLHATSHGSGNRTSRLNLNTGAPTRLDSLQSQDSFADSPLPPPQRSSSSSSSNRPSATTSLCQSKLCYYSLRITLGLLVSGISFLIFLMVFGPKTNDSLDPASWLPGWPDSDPNLGSVGENNIWETDGQFRGLTLQVLNNLESGSNWNEFFETAIQDWDNGDPDAVTLYIRESTQYDPDCRAVRKAMKVCNGNYGPTDWRGVNQILLQDEYIITSLAKMNDYYLDGTNNAQKQYTMCHELGHGLGLGHTDENFHNMDLGNCMDYTERPQNNMHPDDSNWSTLERLYGNVDGTSVRVSMDALPPGRRELGRGVELERFLEEEFERYAAFLSDPVAVSRGESEEHPNAHEGWRLLRKTEKTEIHERDLGNGYSIRTSVLLA